MSEIVKVCKKHGNLTINDVFLRIDYKECKECSREKRRKYWLNNREKRNELLKKYYEKNPDRLKKKQKENYERNKEKKAKVKRLRRMNFTMEQKEHERKMASIRRAKNREAINEYARKRYALNPNRNQYDKKCIDDLHDSYIKSLLVSRTNLKFNEIDQSLIEAKRLQIKLKRKLKEIKNGD